MSPLDRSDPSTVANSVANSVECPTITAIGSCRITNPLRMADQAGFVRLNGSGVYGYTHSSAEAVQMVRVLEGDLDIPELARPLVMPAAEAGPRPRHTPSDLYLVELSSAKEVRLGSILIQLNYLTRHFADFFADKERTRAFWRLAKGDREAEKRAFLQAQPAFMALGFEDQARLQLVTQRPVEEGALRQDIRWLQGHLSEALFVTHCNAVAANGAPLASRAAYIAQTRAALEAEGARYSDPTEQMRKMGQDLALKDQAGSLSHYTEAFEARLFDHWWRTMMAPALAAPQPMAQEA